MISDNRVYFCSKKSLDTWPRLMCDDKATLSQSTSRMGTCCAKPIRPEIFVEDVEGIKHKVVKEGELMGYNYVCGC